MNALSILLKQGVRNDAFWTSAIIFPTFLKWIPFMLDRWALTESERWTADERVAYHRARRSVVLQKAAQLSFWKERLQKLDLSVQMDDAQWQSIPVTKKNDFTVRDEAAYVDQLLKAQSIFDHTSGSTGQPFNFYFDRSAELRSFAVTERMIREVTGGVRYPLIYMRSRYRQGFTFYKHLQFFIRGFTSVGVRLPELQKFALRFAHGFVLYGYTSSVIEVVRKMEEQKVSLPLKAVMATGESLSEVARTDIERITKVPFRMAYASRETGWLAYECVNKKFHLNEAWALVEILDDTGAVCGVGEEGRIVVTTFDNQVQPFIRYAIGDRGMFTGEYCGCGRGGRTIALKGRQSEIILFKSGFRASLLELLATLDAYASAVRRFQIVRKSELTFEVHVVPGATFQQHSDALRMVLLALLAPGAVLAWKVVEHIDESSSGKAAYYVSEYQI